MKYIHHIIITYVLLSTSQYILAMENYPTTCDLQQFMHEMLTRMNFQEEQTTILQAQLDDQAQFHGSIQAQMQRRISFLEEENVDMQNEINADLHSRVGMAEKLESMEKEIQKQAALIAILTKNIEEQEQAQQANNNKKHSEIKSILSAIKTVENSVDGLIEDIAECHASYEKLTIEQKKMTQKIANTASNFKSLKTTVEKSLDEFMNQIDEQSTASIATERSIEAMTKKCDASSHKIDLFTSICKRFNNALIQDQRDFKNHIVNQMNRMHSQLVDEMHDIFSFQQSSSSCHSHNTEAWNLDYNACSSPLQEHELDTVSQEYFVEANSSFSGYKRPREVSVDMTEEQNKK